MKKIILFFLFLSFSAHAYFLQKPLTSINNNQIFIKNQFIFSSLFSQNKNFNTALFLNTISYKPLLSPFQLDVTLIAKNQNFSKNYQSLSSFTFRYAPDNTFNINVQYSPQTISYIQPNWNLSIKKSFFNNSMTIYIHYAH